MVLSAVENRRMVAFSVAVPQPVKISIRRAAAAVSDTCLCSEIDTCRSPAALQISSPPASPERCVGHTAYARSAPSARHRRHVIQSSPKVRQSQVSVQFHTRRREACDQPIIDAMAIVAPLFVERVAASAIVSALTPSSSVTGTVRASVTASTNAAHSAE